MRLLDTNTGHFVEKDPKNTKYAILSHTWDKRGEQTYKQFRKIQKRYEPHPGSSAIPPSGSHPSPNPSVSGMTPTASTPTPNESTPLLLPDRLSLLEQGIPQGHKVDSDSRFIHLQWLILHWVKRLWESLVLLFFFAFPRRFIQAISNNLYNNPPSTLLSAQSAASISRNRVHVRELSSRDAPEPAHAKAPPRSIWDDPELSPKILRACAIARANGYHYIWIDSCCIDQSSSSELSEAINSMYAWYARAHVCYAYLADVPAGEHYRGRSSRFRESRWFRRGWTLQELIAPLNVVFLCQDWTVIGPKYAFSDLVQEITGISEEALLHVESLEDFSVAQRLSWASDRVTTRAEDRAYSLLGIFDINMPTLYGEGTRAFRRLQEEIMQRIPDQSLFAWGEVYLGPPVLGSNTAGQKKSIHCHRDFPGSLIANMPSRFRNNRSTVRSAACLDIISRVQIEYTSSPYGIRTQFQMIPLSLLFPSASIQCAMPGMEDSRQWYLAILGCERPERPGHLLGRVCYIPPSDSAIEFLFSGCLSTNLSIGWTRNTKLFTLSPETIERCRLQIELKTVYIPHPNRTSDNIALQSILRQPHQSISLLLLTTTRNALRARGYMVDFQGPDSGRPTTHCLTLSNDEHAITIEFQHHLENDGKRPKISARVTTSQPTAPPDSTGDFHHVGPSTVSESWTHSFPFFNNLPKLEHKRVTLNAGRAGMLNVDLGLNFICINAYRIRIDVVNNTAPPTPSRAELLQGEESGVSAPMVVAFPQ